MKHSGIFKKGKSGIFADPRLVKRAVALYRKGMSKRAIGRKMKVHESQIRRWIGYSRVGIPIGIPKG